MAKSIPKVSGMDWIIEKLSQKAIEPDEFTAEMIANETKVSRSSVHHRLIKMREIGELTSRKISLNGTTINVYKRASPVE